MAFICSICQKSLKTKKGLTGHMKTQHPDQVNDDQENNDSEVQVLEIKKPDKKSQDATYHCIDCGHPGLQKGANPCPGCGATLDWSAISD